jgi:hypothetical protein
MANCADFSPVIERTAAARLPRMDQHPKGPASHVGRPTAPELQDCPTMTAHPNLPEPAAARPDLLLAAEMQDHLLTASHDLQRLQTLLTGACDTLTSSFLSADADIAGLASSLGNLHQVRAHLARAITALQFQDMAAQLIAHTDQRLRNCADRLAADAFGGDEDGSTVIEAAPLRPNPVTQDEMDAGSVELF